MNFSDWLNNADMPTQDRDGRWYDLEDGIYFDSSKSEKNENFKGSVKQIIWAKDIYKRKAVNLSRQDEDLVYAKKDAKFWIENRDKSISEIIEILKIEKEQKKEKLDQKKIKNSRKKVLENKIAEIKAKAKEWHLVSKEEKDEFYAMQAELRSL